MEAHSAHIYAKYNTHAYTHWLSITGYSSIPLLPWQPWYSLVSRSAAMTTSKGSVNIRDLHCSRLSLHYASLILLWQQKVNIYYDMIRVMWLIINWPLGMSSKSDIHRCASVSSGRMIAQPPMWSSWWLDFFDPWTVFNLTANCVTLPMGVTIPDGTDSNVTPPNLFRVTLWVE